MKRLHFLVLIFLITVSLASCSTQNKDELPAAPSNEDFQTIDEAVSIAIKGRSTFYASGETVTEGHIILDTEEKDGTVKVYTIASNGAFGFENGIFTKVSGSGAIPTVITFSQGENNQYSLLEYKEPMDGSGYGDSVKKMFPLRLHSRVLSAHEDYATLAKQQEEQAEEYLKSIGRTAEVSAAHVEKKLPDIDVQASNKLFSEFTKYNDFLNNCPYWLGTREKVENGVRYIYETSQSKTDDGCDLITFSKKKEDGTIVEEYNYKIVGSEPRLEPSPLSGESKVEASDILTLRGKYLNFGIENRLDYVPLFNEGEAPTDSAEYLFYAFAINLDKWGDDKGIMTREYVEEVIRTHFEVENITHSPLHKGWDYDGEKYIAVPQGIKEKPIYVLQTLNTKNQNGRTVYEITMDICLFGDAIPSDEDMENVRANIVLGDLSNLTVLQTERFQYYIHETTGNVVFLSHILQ